MKFKKTFINLALTLSSIYIPLLTFSAFDYTQYYFKKHSNYKTENHEKELISAVQDGYIPTFLPNNFFNQQKIPKTYLIGSLPNTQSFFCDEGYGLIKYKTDRFGLRNLDQKWDKFANGSNIFLIGDSFTHGACLPDEKLISSHIEVSTKKNTFNLGMAGNSPYEYIAILKSLVRPLINESNKDNKVIIIFYSNDNLPVNDKKEQLLSSVKSIFNMSNKNSPNLTIDYRKNINFFIKDNYPTTQKKIISELNRKKNYFNKNFFYTIASLFNIRRRIGLSGLNYLSLSSQLSENSPSLRSISLLSESCQNPCKPYVAYIPSSSYWDPHPYNKNYKKELKKIAHKFSIPFIDGEEVIDSNNLSDYAPKGPHLSIKGYKKFADLISKKIKNNL